MAKSPDAFRTISEVAEWLDTPAHVLRFWESKFSQVKPVKRAGGRRYYRPADMELLGGIKKLLHEDGMTIKGVQKMLSERGIKAVAAYSVQVETHVSADEADADEAPFAPDAVPGETAPELADDFDDTPVAPLQEDVEPEPLEPSRVVAFAPVGSAATAETRQGGVASDPDVSEEERGLSQYEAAAELADSQSGTATGFDRQDAAEQDFDTKDHGEDAPSFEEHEGEPHVAEAESVPVTDDSPRDSHAAASTHGGLFPQAAGPVPDFLSTPLDVRLRRASPEAPDPTDAVAGAEVSPAEEEPASAWEAEWQEPPSAETHVPKDGDGSAAEVDADFTASGPDQPPSQSIPAATNHAPPVEGISTDAEAAPHDDRHRALSDEEHMPSDGTLVNIARLARLTPAQAARIVPLAAKLRAFVDR